MQDDTSRGGLGPRGREALIPTSGGSPFDCIRRVTPEGREFWSARDLMPLLGYEKWERFADAITRAKISARNAGYDPAEQFPGAGWRRCGCARRWPTPASCPSSARSLWR